MGKKNKPDSKGFVYSTDPSFSFEEDQNDTETLPTSQQKLRVKLDTKHRAGKAVTLIEGFVGKDEDMEKLGKELKTFCGSGGSVKGREIIVQGDHRDKVVAWLSKNGYKQVKRI